MRRTSCIQRRYNFLWKWIRFSSELAWIYPRANRLLFMSIHTVHQWWMAKKTTTTICIHCIQTKTAAQIKKKERKRKKGNCNWYWGIPQSIVLTYEKKCNLHKELNNFRTLEKKTLWLLLLFHFSLLRARYVYVFITCMYRLSKRFPVVLGKIYSVFVVVVGLFVCSLGLLNVARSLLSFDHLHDGVFNEISDRLIREDNIKCTISQSLHCFTCAVCVCFLCCCCCCFYFGNFVIPF